MKQRNGHQIKNNQSNHANIPLAENHAVELKTLHAKKIFIATLIGTFLVMFNNSLMNVALPFFVTHFQIQYSQSQWIISVFVMAMAFSMPLTSYMVKKYGAGRVFLVGILIFLVGSLFGALSWDFTGIIISRFIQGIAGGLLTPISMVIIYELFPKNKRGAMMGIWGITVMLAPTLGPIVAGIIIENFSWTMLFYINLPFLLLCLFLVGFKASVPTTSKAHFDLQGYLLLSISVALLLYGLNLLHSNWKIALMCILPGLIFLCVFTLLSVRKSEPILEVSILKNYGYLGSLIVLSINTVAQYSILVLLPILIQDVLILSPIITGALLLPHGLIMGLSMTVGGKYLDRLGAYKVILFGTSCLTLATFLLAVVDYQNMVLLTLILLGHGIGCGLMSTPTTTAGLNVLQEKMIPSGSALNNLWRQIVKALAVIVIIYLYEIPYLESSSTGKINTIFLFVAVLLTITIPFIMTLKSRWGRE